MKLKLTFVLLTSLFFSTKAFSIVSCEQLNDLWINKYHGEFRIEWKKATFKCPSYVNGIARAFYDLENFQFHPEVPRYYKWVKDNVPGFKYELQYTGSAKIQKAAASACVGCKITLHNSFAGDSSTFEYTRRVSAIIHETRHVQADDPSHVICKKGYYKGQFACDQTFYLNEWKGSGYNFEFKFLRDLKERSNEDGLTKSLATTSMSWLILNHFNKVDNKHVVRFSK